MRIVHILNTGNYSGAENVAITIINETKKRNINSVYMSLDGPIREVLNSQCIEFYPVEKLSIHIIAKAIRKLKPDVIHAHDYTASILTAVCFPKAKIICHLHNNSPWIKKRCFYSYAFLISTLNYKTILTVSDSIEKEYVFSKYIKKKLKCIGNPIDISLIKTKANEYNIDEYYDLIFLGRLTAPKNPKLLLNIFESLCNKNSNIRIAVVGEGDQFDVFRNEVITKKLEKNVTMYGFVKNPYPILKNSKVLCLPSKWEGFGLVAIEALTLGIPVVCSGVGGLCNFINENNGKVCNFNLKEYVNEISELCVNDKYYKIKSKEAIASAKELNNIIQYTDFLTTLYKTLGCDVQ